MTTSMIIVYSIRGVILLAFLALGVRELAMLFQRHDRRMGTGLSRVWAVALVTMREAWAGRVWLLPVLWLAAGLLLISGVRPFDESERLPLYIKALLSTEEALILVMMWIMACVSLPRERERKILISNASKPLSRLEIVLGKITGFSVVAALSVLAMGIVGMVVLQVSDLRLRHRAKEAYAIQVRDFNDKLITPSEALKEMSEKGSLFAYNNIKVPPGGLNIGVLSIPREEGVAPIRHFMGGTQERAIYTFERLDVHEVVLLRPPGQRPYFVFFFPVVKRDGAPPENKIRVVAYAGMAAAPQEKLLTLNSQGMAYWEPDHPDLLFSTFDTSGQLKVDRGAVTVEVTSPTPGIWLQVLEGAAPDPTTGQVDQSVAFNVEFGDRRESLGMGLAPQTQFPNPRPVVRGFERRDRQEISGATENRDAELAIYRFSGASLKNVPVDDKGNFQLSLQLETYKSDNPGDPTYAGIRVHSLDRTSEDFDNPRIEVMEKRSMTVDVPAANLGDKDPGRRGDMIVMVYCATPGHSLSLIEDSVRIELPQTPFFVNYFKSQFVILLETVLLITIAVTCSVRLGWPVAVLVSGVCFMFGYFVDFILGLREYGGLGALNYQSYGHDTAMFQFFDKAFDLLWMVLGFISILVPNFTLYQPAEYIGSLQNMPWQVLLNDVTNTLIFIVPIIALAHLMFRKQELG